MNLVPIYGPCGKHGELNGDPCWVCESARPFLEWRDAVVERYKKANESALYRDPIEYRQLRRRMEEELEPIRRVLGEIEIRAIPVHRYLVEDAP